MPEPPTSQTLSQTLTLNLPTALKLQITPDQFAILAASNRTLRLERTAQGELSVNPPTGWETGERNRSIIGQLDHWYNLNGCPGKAFDSSTGFTLPNGAIFSPDASWVSPDRWDALTDQQKETFAAVCPDFVVELRSQSDSLKALQTKLQDYRANGARLGWLLDPKNRTVEIYRSDRAVEVLSSPTTLSGEDVLVGFTLNLTRVWG
ncbi:MAG: Uma2 family endonuclease [Coleofasciculaceae cyanobacterium RL_1_1]|nr:Uma2 family endonuclease [Coleofasciculaceae cyanobacterium RL_1_1]